LPTTSSSFCSIWSAIGAAMMAAPPGSTCSSLPWTSTAVTTPVATRELMRSMTAGSPETVATMAA